MGARCARSLACCNRPRATRCGSVEVARAQRGDRSMVNARRMDIEPMTLHVERICELYPRAPQIAVRTAEAALRSGVRAARGQRIRRMCTLCTSPNIAKYTMRPEPPYEMNGSGSPVTGMIRSVIPTFWNVCQSTIVNTPAQR